LEGSAWHVACGAIAAHIAAQEPLFMDIARTGRFFRDCPLLLVLGLLAALSACEGPVPIGASADPPAADPRTALSPTDPEPDRGAFFMVTVKNTSAQAWTEGLITLRPLFALGPSPQPGSTEYATYAYAAVQCRLEDSFCGADECEDGDATTLARRWRLDIDRVARLVPALGPGESAALPIIAYPGDRLSYVARVGGSLDDVVALHVPGAPADLGVPLFEPQGAPRAMLPIAISGYDINSADAQSGNGAPCSATCARPEAGCFIAPGNGSTGLDLPAQPVPVQALTGLDTRGPHARR
jgi:hypothetical protein